MDTSPDVGTEPSLRIGICDVNLCGRDLAADLNRLSYVRAYAFEELVKAISKQDITLTNTLLRRWGIW